MVADWSQASLSLDVDVNACILVNTKKLLYCFFSYKINKYYKFWRTQNSNLAPGAHGFSYDTVNVQNFFQAKFHVFSSQCVS